MARTTLAVTEVTRAGVAVQAFVACDQANGMQVLANIGDVEIELDNSGASDKTVTVVANPTLNTDGLTVNSLVLTVPYGFTYKFGPFKPNSFRQDASGLLYLDFSSGANFTIRATKRVTDA
jgi:hypothetical protein